MIHPQRLPYPDLGSLSPAQIALREAMGPRRGGPDAGTLMRLLVHFPVFGHAMSSLGARTADNNSLPPRLFQIACLRTVWLCDAEYLWSQHCIAARKIGLNDEDFRAIAEGDPSRLDAEGGMVLRAVDELHHDHRLSDESWSGLDQLGPDAKIDVILTHGVYILMSSFANSVGAPLEPGATGYPAGLTALRDKRSGLT